MYKLFSTERFLTESSRLFNGDVRYRKRVEKVLGLMRNDLKHPSLRWHKLEGSRYYSISVDMSVRIIVAIDEDEIYLLRIGKHEEVY